MLRILVRDCYQIVAPGRGARCQMAEAICSRSVFITWRAKGKLLSSGSRRQETQGGGPEDYVRSPRKRNIERNLIMSAMRIGHARFRSVCGPGTFIHHRAENAGASGKGFSDRCGKQSPSRQEGTVYSSSVTRLRVGCRER